MPNVTQRHERQDNSDFSKEAQAQVRSTTPMGVLPRQDSFAINLGIIQQAPQPIKNRIETSVDLSLNASVALPLVRQDASEDPQPLNPVDHINHLRMMSSQPSLLESWLNSYWTERVFQQDSIRITD